MIRKATAGLRVRSIPTQQEREALRLLSTIEAKELEQLADVVECDAANAQILLRGEPAKYLYLVITGIVAADRTLPGGERQVIAFYWPGDVFGLDENGVYLNSARTLTPCTLYRFRVERLSRFLRQRANVQHNFLVKALHDLRKTQRQVVLMGRLNVARRLARFLLDCAEHASYFNTKTQVLTLPMTRYDVADYLGTSAETATRALSRLEQGGLLKRLDGRAMQLRRSRLAAFANLD
jgi:CRP-like cAMP-binding protein